MEKKLNISLDDAKDQNLKFHFLIQLINTRIDTSCDAPVNWECFPNDDPTIVIYMGYPDDSDIVKWAVNYQKTA